MSDKKMTEVERFNKAINAACDRLEIENFSDCSSELFGASNAIITTIESLQREISSHGPEGRNYTNQQYVDLLQKSESQKEEIEELKWKIAHPVHCSGICTSQLDDYCGMYMTNESCIACNAIWTNAHVENEVFSYKTITELAVKGLKNITVSGDECTKRDLKIHAQLTISEIERLLNGTT